VITLGVRGVRSQRYWVRCDAGLNVTGIYEAAAWTATRGNVHKAIKSGQVNTVELTAHGR
jgi:hypothetical protein